MGTCRRPRSGERTDIGGGAISLAGADARNPWGRVIVGDGMWVDLLSCEGGLNENLYVFRLISMVFYCFVFRLHVVLYKNDNSSIFCMKKFRAYDVIQLIEVKNILK